MAKRKLFNKRIWLLSIHLIFAGSWIGATFVLLLLSLSARWNMSINAQVALPELIYMTDLHCMRIAGIGTIISGGFLAGSYWGFTRFYWVIVKEIASLSLVFIGAIWLEPFEKEAMAITSTQGIKALHNPQYLLLHKEILWILIGWMVVMIAMVVISKLKPWGKVKGAKTAA